MRRRGPCGLRGVAGALSLAALSWWAPMGASASSPYFVPACGPPREAWPGTHITWRYLGSVRCSDRLLPLRSGARRRGMGSGARQPAAPHRGGERRGWGRPWSPAARVSHGHCDTVLPAGGLRWGFIFTLLDADARLEVWAGPACALQRLLGVGGSPCLPQLRRLLVTATLPPQSPPPSSQGLPGPPSLCPPRTRLMAQARGNRHGLLLSEPACRPVGRALSTRGTSSSGRSELTTLGPPCAQHTLDLGREEPRGVAGRGGWGRRRVETCLLPPALTRPCLLGGFPWAPGTLCLPGGAREGRRLQRPPVRPAGESRVRTLRRLRLFPLASCSG